MAQTVIGIFDSSSEAQQAVQQLRNTGFSDDRIDISSASNNTAGSTGSYGSSTTGTTGAYGSTGTTSTYNQSNHDDNDGIGGFFRNLFSDDDDNAQVYSQVARHSDCLVTVHAQSGEEASRAADILDQYGAVDVTERAAQYGYTGNSFSNTTSGADTTGTTSIPIIEENLQVGKREVETGGARLRSRIVERPVEEHLRLRSEHIRVERHAVDRPATEADFNNFQEGDLEITEHAEVPIVNKEARVVEEVSLGKEVEERDEVIRDTVRSTEVDVDQTGARTNRLDTDLDNDRNTTGGTLL